MKKLFSILTVVVIFTMLFGCGFEESNSEEYDYDALVQRINELEDTVSDQRENMQDMESMIATMENHINEDRVVFTVDTGEATLARTVPYMETADLDAFELLGLAYDIEYEESDFGILIEGIESLQAQQGSFIAISKNGSMIETSLAEASFEGGDHFHFELQWWDETLEAVDHSIELFMEHQADDLLEAGNFHVALGLHHLGYDDMLQTLDMPDPGEEAGVGALIEAIFVQEVMGEDASDLRDRLAKEAATGHAYSASQTYLALETGDIGDYDGFASDFKALLDDFEWSEADNDTISMVLLALTVMDDSEYDDLSANIVDHLKDHAYDNEYGDNPATFASIVTALTGAEEDVTEEPYVKDGENVVEHLLAYRTEDGAFLHSLDDEEPDLMFSTPQAFLALAAYQASLNSGTFSHPYSVD